MIYPARLFYLLLPVLFLVASPLHAEEYDDAMAGFDELDPSSESPSLPPTSEEVSRGWELTGFLTLSGTYSYAHDPPVGDATDYRGLSRLRTETQFDLERRFDNGWKFFASGRGWYDALYRMRDDFRHETVHEMESEIEWRDIYLQGSLTRNVDLKVGRQIVAWGTSDTIRVVDLINPLDLREPGLVDIEDLRLPVAMTRLDFYGGKWAVQLLAIHEKRYNKNAPLGSDFNPSLFPFPETRTYTEPEYAAALTGTFSGWDISFHAVRMYDNQFSFTPGRGGFIENRSYLTMVGLAGDWAVGSWLFKGEMAQISGIDYFNTPKRGKRLDAMLGLEYSGLADTTIALDLALRHIQDFDPGIGKAPDFAQEESWQSAVRVIRKFMNDRFTFLGLVSFFGLHGEEGGYARLSLDDELRDGLTLTGGVMAYLPGNSPFLGGVADNDRLFMSLKYAF